MLQDCSERTNWGILEQQDLEDFTSSVLSYIKFCMDIVTTEKRVLVYPNQKPWMTGEVRTLLKERNEAFRCGDGAQYSAARASLKRGIREAKTAYQRRTEEHLSSSNTRQVWQEVQHITGYKSNNLSEGESRLPPLSIHQHQHRLPPRAVL